MPRAEFAGYDRETVYKYIDGAAGAHRARLGRCVVTTYRFAGAAGEFEVATEVYRFAAAAGAVGQAEAARGQRAGRWPGRSPGHG